MPKQKKILIAITDSNWGGAQRYVFDISTYLQKEGHLVRVVAGGTGSLLTQLEKEGVRTTCLQHGERDIHFLKEFRLLFEFWSILRLEKPDVLHINSSKIGAVGAILGRLCGIKKVIFTSHGWVFKELHRSWLKRFVFKCISWITCLFSHVVIVTAQKEFDAVAHWPGVQKKLVIIPLALPSPLFLTKMQAQEKLIALIHAGNKQIIDTENKRWFCSISLLNENKGLRYALEALALYKKTHGDTFLYIIMGDGELRESLESQVRTLELEPNVFFAGFVPSASQYLKAFDTLILPSIKEGFVYVLLEAGHAGIGRVATSVIAAPEIMSRNIDALVPPSNPEALCQAIERVTNLSQEPQPHYGLITFENMISMTKDTYGL
jgi:glycosyltransferase involved in cell wall biosynthesis